MNTGFKDHYQVLGIKKNSSHEQVKEAFRKLSMEHHPDKNNNSESSNRTFRIIVNSYEILSDDLKRREYDEFLNKSEYLHKFYQSDAVYLSGAAGYSNAEILEKINISLWEIDDYLTNKTSGKLNMEYILIILTFLDKWILEPYGFPDYFMEARQLKRYDPRDYIKILSGPTVRNSHLPYNNLNEYYFDVRKRANKFISKYEKRELYEEPGSEGCSLLDRIIEYSDMAIHYLSYIIGSEKEREKIIPEYEFSNKIFNYDY